MFLVFYFLCYIVLCYTSALLLYCTGVLLYCTSLLLQSAPCLALCRPSVLVLLPHYRNLQSLCSAPLQVLCVLMQGESAYTARLIRLRGALRGNLADVIVHQPELLWVSGQALERAAEVVSSLSMVHHMRGCSAAR